VESNRSQESRLGARIAASAVVEQPPGDGGCSDQAGIQASGMSSPVDALPSAPDAQPHFHGTTLPRRGATDAINPRWIPWIFAAKTSASGLLALLVAFAFNLDQPKWALLSVFIVAQPQSGLVLAKSFYRIIGTFVGAAVALTLVAFFAQERVLFLGALALWIGLCTFASVRARNFAAYGFVLSGYTVAIVGIPGALDPENAFFIAVARVTEISLGIMTTAAISHLVLPVSLSASLRRAIASGRGELADYAAALLGGTDTAPQRTKLLGRAVEIESLCASAVFEDRDIRARSHALRRLDTAMLGAVDIAYLVGRSLSSLRRGGAGIVPALDVGLARAAAAIDLWRRGKDDAAGFSRHLAGASACLPLARELYREPAASDQEIIRQAAAVVRLREFFASLAAFAEAYEAFLSAEPQPAGSVRFSASSDGVGAIWAGSRAAMALLLTSTFWILADWPSGATASILAAVATARLATMEGPLRAAAGGTVVFVLAAVPSFILVEILLPEASGFEMLALAVAPMLFCCAFLMAHAKTAGLGFLSGLYFASTAGFQDRMAYDPVGFLNTSIALVLAVATAAVLFAVVAPDTPQAARRRFVRAAQRAFRRIVHGRPRIGLIEFETTMTEALDQLRRGIRPDRVEDAGAVQAGIALLGAGRELIRVRDDARLTSVENQAGEVVRFLASDDRLPLERARRAAQDASVACLEELRDDKLGVAEARAAAREMVAFATIRDELELGGELIPGEKSKEVLANAA
jgi:uncharacterized membrane protein YccC